MAQILVRESAGWGLLETAALEQRAGAAEEDEPLTALGWRPLPHLFPDQPLHIALGRLGDAPFLPVVDRTDPSRLLGIVTLPDILAAYDAARQIHPAAPPRRPSAGPR